MVEKAREWDMELEFRTKRKPEQAQTTAGQAKKPKTSDSSGRGQQGHGRCVKCGRSHGGVYRASGSGGRGPVKAPVPATMRITDGHPAKVDTLAVKSHTFQLTTEEARAASDVVAGIFVVNGMSVHVLFDSGVTRSFVSLVLSKKLRDAPRTLDSPLEVEIADDRTVKAARVYRDCVLNGIGERFRVDLVLIPLRGLKVIVEMDWLGANGAMID
ncbi:hypothetical protein Lser_V15G01624 [Lactuca serriola]